MIEIIGITSEIVIGIGGDHRVEKVLFKRQIFGVGFDGDDLLLGQPHLAEEFAVFFGIAPKIGGIYAKAILFGKKDAGQSLPAAQIANGCVFGNLVARQKLLFQFNGVWPHDFGEQFGRLIFCA